MGQQHPMFCLPGRRQMQAAQSLAISTQIMMETWSRCGWSQISPGKLFQDQDHREASRLRSGGAMAHTTGARMEVVVQSHPLSNR